MDVAARAEATDASDIDVSLVIAGDSGQSLAARSGVDGWQDGIYYIGGTSSIIWKP